MRNVNKRKRTEEDKYISYDISNQKYRLRMDGVNKYFATKEEALEERNKQMAIIQMQSEKFLSPDTTLEDWVAYYLSEYCVCRPSVKSDYQRLLENCIDEGLWGKRLIDISKNDLNKCLRYLMKKNRAISSIKKAKAVLSRIFTAIKENELLPESLLPNLNLMKITEGCTAHIEEEKRAFPTSELIRLVTAAADFTANKETCLKYQAIITLLIYTGMRRSEVLGLCKNNIDVINDDTVFIKVRTTSHDSDAKVSPENKPWNITTVKSRLSRREFKVTVPGIGTLIRHLESIKHPTITYQSNTYDLLFATQTGTPISERNFTRSFVKIRKLAGMDVKCHEIRHSYATYLASINTPYLAAAERMGHSPEMYLKRYGHVYDASRSKIDESIAALAKRDAKSRSQKRKDKTHN